MGQSVLSAGFDVPQFKLTHPVEQFLCDPQDIWPVPRYQPRPLWEADALRGFDVRTPVRGNVDGMRERGGSAEDSSERVAGLTPGKDGGEWTGGDIQSEERLQQGGPCSRELPPEESLTQQERPSPEPSQESVALLGTSPKVWQLDAVSQLYSSRQLLP